MKCITCGKELGFRKYKISNDTYLCIDCFAKLGGISNLNNIKKMSTDQIKNEILNYEKNTNENNEKISEFNPTRKVMKYFYIDENKKQWCIPDNFITGSYKKAKIYSYDDVKDFELLEDNEIMSKAGLGKTIAGGMLFGSVGAVVGSATTTRKQKTICNKMQVKIELKNSVNSPVYLTLIDIETKKDSLVYKTSYQSAQEILSFLQMMIDESNSIQNISNNSSNLSVADELKKYKDLLDSNAITIEEYNQLKSKLFNL